MNKILIPIMDAKGLESFPSDSLGRAPFYLLYDEDTSNGTIIPNDCKKLNITPIKFVIKQHASIVFTKEACKNSLEHLKNSDIVPYLVEHEKVIDLIHKYQNGELSILNAPTH